MKCCMNRSVIKVFFDQFNTFNVTLFHSIYHTDPNCIFNLSQGYQPQGTHQQISGLHQQPRSSNTGLRAGYIPIPVIHEGAGGVLQSQLSQSSHPTREKIYREQVPIQIQQNRAASPILVPLRAQSPVMAQIMGERPQVCVLFIQGILY